MDSTRAWISSADRGNSVRTVATVVLLLVVIRTLRKHFTHPLYKIPGPRLAAWTNFPYSRMFLGGRQPYEMVALHEKYGPVVRVAPNEVSFSSPASWEDIYGFRPGHKTFVKSEFYDGGSFADQVHSIVSERDPVEHGRMRKYLSHAFSDASIKKQEALIAENVDLLIRELGSVGLGSEGINIVKWFNLTTFDIIGSLAFGESFGGLSSQIFHFWIDLVTKALRQGALADTMSRFPFVAFLFRTLMPGTIRKFSEDTKTHENHTMALIEKRLAKPKPRPDFLTRVLEQKEDITPVQLAAHASDFVTAGSETTATTLSCITYYLLKDAVVEDKVKREIRGAFSKYEDINSHTATRLPYLRAVCLEAMRVYAPLPFALPRVVPEGGDTVDGIMLPAGTTVSTNPVAAGLSSANWTNPYEFRPERWLGKEKGDRLDAAQPFSLGPRGCLGRNLAWAELSTIISKLYFTYDLELLNKDLDWHRESRMATLWIKPELRVRVKHRADN
ncbi:cytochrome P450 [Podospora appendiculata]|uniref:Cytochrome P450 n=1 Tax=Podospora appendiculata TaxID=314037 RepID=A0AAE0X929_9PEZI|nr:cytochrome P450 [Podospora appendiculata]